MPLFYFHVRDGVDIPDKEGTECASLEDARNQAVKSAGESIKELGPTFWDADHDWQMTVTDEGGAVQFTMRFSPR